MRLRPSLWIPFAAAPLWGGITVVPGGDEETFVFYSALALVIAGMAVTTTTLMRRGPMILWVTASLAFSWGAVSLVVSSDGQSLVEWMLYFFGGLVFGILTVATGVVLVARGTRSGLPLWRILPAPFVLQLLFLFFVFVGVSFGLAFRARFAVSRPALEAAALDVRSGSHAPAPGRIGLFHVAEIDRAGDSVRFIVGEAGLDHCGLVHSPRREPPVVGEDSYEHLQGPWWFWHRSW
ncbi:MAG: hypothetical protein ACKVXR_16185 [Planctomycetota bacterium]